MRKIILAGVAAAALAAGVAIPAASASAATSVTVKTISPMHPDTTGVTGSATQTDPNRGPVWATDRLAEKIIATQQATGKWNVKIQFGGSTFAGFADPRSGPEGSTDPGGPMLTQGAITGSIQYNGITGTPDITAVPAVQAPNTSLGAVLAELFGGPVSAAHTNYLINYTPAFDGVQVTGSGNTWSAGDTYTQAG
jgi:hypothetical protein